MRTFVLIINTWSKTKSKIINYRYTYSSHCGPVIVHISSYKIFFHSHCLLTSVLHRSLYMIFNLLVNHQARRNVGWGHWRQHIRRSTRSPDRAAHLLHCEKAVSSGGDGCVSLELANCRIKTVQPNILLISTSIYLKLLRAKLKLKHHYF